MLPHHDQQASDDRNQTEHGWMLSSNMLLLNLILLIDVTFSTPTPDYNSYHWKPMNLSQKAVSILSALQYDPSAGCGFNVTEFGSIFWNDEMPDMFELFGNAGDRFLIYSMFALRLKTWDGQALTAEDQRLWDSVKAQVPDWPFFKRLFLTNEQKQAREQAEKDVQLFFDILGFESLVREFLAGEKQWNDVHNFVIESEWRGEAYFPPGSDGAAMKDLYFAFLPDSEDDGLSKSEIQELLDRFDLLP